MKCSDISDGRFIAAVKTVIALRKMPASRSDVGAVLDGHPEWVGQPQAIDGESVSVPEKVIMAKARKMIRRKLLTGCWCGCRGDFEPVAAGRRGLRCTLEINDEIVDLTRPRYWVPEQKAAAPSAVRHWSGWQVLGATTDEIPPAFRRR